MDFTKDFFNLLLDFGDERVITNIESNHKTQEVFLGFEYAWVSPESYVATGR